LEAPIVKSKGSRSINRASSAHMLRLYLDWLKNPVAGFTKRFLDVCNG